MPIERKILLSLLFVILGSYAGYFLFYKVYTPYKDNKVQIEYYNRLINKIDYKDITKIPDIESLKERRSYLNNLFSKTKNLNINTLSLSIKKALNEENISISEFRTGNNSVTFNISGNIYNFNNFFYKLYKRDNIYVFNQLNIKMNNNLDFSGSLDISYIHESEEGSESNKIDNLRNDYKLNTFNKNYANIFGTTFYKEQITSLPKEIIQEIIPEKPIYTDKFNYIGKLKNESEEFILFKESNNGRIYKFSKGVEISGWKLVDQKDLLFVFENNGKLYEVKR